MARALIVGCGGRGRDLGRELIASGWQVRGTSRSDAGLAAIAADGIEPARADPDRVGTVLEQVTGVTFVFWLLGTARGEPEAVSAVHGPRLESLLDKLVDSPVRGFVYEAGGTVPAADLAHGSALVADAAQRWRIPVELVTADPAQGDVWRPAMLAATERLLG